jgi:hypothetical protein
MDKLTACSLLFNKCKLLKPNEYYYTTFGPEHSFSIESNNELKIWNCYYTFEYQPLKVINLKDASSLVLFLDSYPKYYAENYFTKQLIHMDNWVNFINGFKLKEYKETDKYIK